MLKTAEIITDLQDKNWDMAASHIQVSEHSVSIYSFHKLLNDGIDVIVSIHQEPDSFVVWCSAEHRLSGPCDTIEGKAQSVEDALLLVQVCCKDWDNR